MTLKRGKHGPAKTPEVSDLRVLGRADLAVLAVKRPTNSLAALRDSHHRVARAIAAGMRGEDLTTLVGYSATRVSILRADPAFQELIAHYRGMVNADFATAMDPVIEMLASVRAKSLAMIEDKIDAAAEANEFLPSRDLATFAELGLDRTGYGKVNRNVNVNVDFAAALEKARTRSASARPQIEAQAISGREPRSPHATSVAPEPPRGASTFRRL